MTLQELVDGQWVDRHTETKALTPSYASTELTITAQLNQYGYWQADVQENPTPRDGRIYINPMDPPNTFGLMIWQPDPPDATMSNFESVYLYLVEEVEEGEHLVVADDMHWYQRTFLQPEKDRLHQQKVSAALNDPVLLEIYVCFTEDGHLPALSEYSTPEAFAGLDYAFAVTATFTDQPPQ